MTIALPPYAQALRIETSRDDIGRIVLTMPFGSHVQGRPNFLHGGAIAGLLEIAAFASLRDALGEEGATAQMKPITVTTDYMRGGRARLTYAAAVISRLGQRMANVESFAWQEEETKPIAAARMNFLLVRD
ncbi:MAG: PaaI family thioesterase [Parasphingopyxis sp.]